MTTFTRSNRLPVAVALGLFGVAVTGVLLSLLTSDPEDAVMRQVPGAPTPDVDSPATVIRTLSAQVETMREQSQSLRQDNQTLQQTLQGVQARLEQVLRTPPPAPDTGPLERLTAELTRLSGRIQTLEQPVSTLELPVGRPTADPDTLVWIEPLDADVPVPAQAAIGQNWLQSLTPPVPPPLPPVSQPVPSVTQATTPTFLRPEPPAPIPYYTLPANATLMNATAWTALLGRVPVNGQVRDPWRFKVLTGADNLAANGIRIPGLTGMVWSGTAVGDLALACVSGTLDSVTYVFQDGHIVTHQGEGNKTLGWISDGSGIPCVPGEVKSNAPAFLGLRTALLALEAGADAAATSETTRSTGPLGNSSTTVSGEIGPYVLGKTLAGGAQEVQRWVADRVGQSFDAVLVRPGARLTLHLEQTLPIDYAPDGRRVSYARRAADPYRSPGLD